MPQFETELARRMRQNREHYDKYERLAHWLGVPELIALVPFTPEQIRTALAAGDEHLNTLPLASWDAKHGYHKDDNAGRGFTDARGNRLGATHQPCPCCGQLTLKPDLSAGVWGLVRAAARRDNRAVTWSLSDTVSVLKHVARCHMVKSDS